MKPNLFSSLRQRSFALLWSGQTISGLGDSLQRIAISWYLVQKTGSAATIGTLFIFTFVPNLIFLLLGGVAVDRFPRLRVMLLSDLFRGLLVGVIAALAFVEHLEVWHLYVMATAFGFVDAFFQPAYVAAVPDIAPAELLPSANSLTDLSGRVVGIAGPAVGALLIKLGGVPTAFALDALSFFISAACLMPLPSLAAPRTTDVPLGNMFTDVRAGIGVVAASPWLWITIALAAITNVTIAGPLSVALPFLVKERLGADVGILGLISSMIALGSVLAAIWMGRVARLRHRGIMAYGASLLSGLMVLAFGLPIGLVGILGAAVVLGATFSVFGLIWTNMLQELVPRKLLGRVSSVDQMGSFALLPVGYAITGWATDRLGPVLVFVIGGVVTVVVKGIGLLHPAIRQLD